MGVYIALLRGINVGGNNKLPMKDLAALFEKAGCKKVVTYIQSGNVVFEADAKTAKAIAETMNKAVLKAFKIEVPFIVRDAATLQKIARKNPFLKKAKTTQGLCVGFLGNEPTKAQIALLDPKRSEPDEYEVIGSEVYFWFPHGMGKSKFTSQYFDSRLKTVMTIRSWNTILKVAEMSEAL